MRHTKIVCTLGPSTDDYNTLREMMLAGMNVARLNFSHGSHEEHKRRAEMVKKLRAELGLPIAIMIDTKGPDIRVGRFENNFIELRAGDSFTLTGETENGMPVLGDESRAGVTYAGLSKHVKPGDYIMLDDGLMKAEVKAVNGLDVNCVIIDGGVLANNKSINVPGVKLNIPYMREKDVEDILFSIENGFDYIAASFVRSRADIDEILKILESKNATSMRIIAKIENIEGIENIDSILDVCDCIMIARGDMGVELPFERLPAIQKDLIKKAQAKCKKIITATQMLESMIKNPRPTRAETSDVANAIYDGTSAVMLSGETAVGKYPVQTVKTMNDIALTTESDIDYNKRFLQYATNFTSDITRAVSHATCALARDLSAKAIVTLTNSGVTAHNISRFRPKSDIIAFTSCDKVYNQLALAWGVLPFKLEQMDDAEKLYQSAVKILKDKKILEEGDSIVFTAGFPLGVEGGTNFLRVGVIK